MRCKEEGRDGALFHAPNAISRKIYRALCDISYNEPISITHKCRRDIRGRIQAPVHTANHTSNNWLWRTKITSNDLLQ